MHAFLECSFGRQAAEDHGLRVQFPEYDLGRGIPLEVDAQLRVETPQLLHGDRVDRYGQIPLDLGQLELLAPPPGAVNHDEAPPEDDVAAVDEEIEA